MKRRRLFNKYFCIFFQISPSRQKRSSPKGNDAHLRAIIQSEKKWKHHFLALKGSQLCGPWSDLAEFQTHPSSYVSMKLIPSRTTEKKGQHHFSNYNTICCHGNRWSDLAEFQTHPSFYACPHCCKYEKDQLKNSGENVMTSFSPLQVYGIFFRRSGAANSVVHGRISPNFELIQVLMYIINTCKYTEQKKKRHIHI